MVHFMNKRSVIVVGAFHEVIELCENCQRDIVGIIDNHQENFYESYPILGKDLDARFLFEKYLNCELVISPDAPLIRKRLVHYYSEIGFSFATLISPSAYVSKSAKVSEGCVIQAGVILSSSAKVGRFVKLNVRSTIMHDNTIGDYVTIAPHAVCLGDVQIDSMAYIGANATILPHLRVGKQAIVGAGAVVTKQVADYKMVKGIPAM